MFLQRYNPWGKTKRDQLQSWNILTFDPQKTDVDEHINLINTLGDMLGQTAESKMEKFVDTMPTIIQTHLITCKNWEKITKKAKELEHIIRKCDPPAAALPNLTQGTAVPGLYSHIAHSNDKEETDIPQPFKGARPKEKANSHNRSQNPLQYRYKRTNTLMMMLIITTTMRIIEVSPEAIDLTEAKILGDFSEVKICMVGANAYQGQYQSNNYQGNNYQGNHGLYHNPHRNYQQGNNYSQYRGRSHGYGRGNYHRCNHSRSNYQGNNNYQNHQ